MCPGTDAGVATVTFQGGPSFVEFILDDAVNDVSFSFLPTRQVSGQSSLSTSPLPPAATQVNSFTIFWLFFLVLVLLPDWMLIFFQANK